MSPARAEIPAKERLVSLTGRRLGTHGSSSAGDRRQPETLLCMHVIYTPRDRRPRIEWLLVFVVAAGVWS
jgi:hypothetical protein